MSEVIHMAERAARLEPNNQDARVRCFLAQMSGYLEGQREYRGKNVSISGEEMEVAINIVMPHMSGGARS